MMADSRKVFGLLTIALLVGALYAVWRMGSSDNSDNSGNAVLSGGDGSEEERAMKNSGEQGEQFLLTRSTGERNLGCGPPDDFDCGVNRYSGYMALANIEAYQNTKDARYLDYAISFATTEQAQGADPPNWCHSCICNPPDDLDCGSGEVQAEMIDVFARLYDITGEETYLEYAEGFAHTQPSSPPESCKDCSCGPPEDFDCGETYIQTNYLGRYRQLFEATDNPKYLDYAKGLGDAWMGKTIEDKGPGIIGLFIRIYELTGDETYLDHATSLGRGMVGESCGDMEPRWEAGRNYDFDETAYVGGLTWLYTSTGNGRYLECATDLITNGEQCKERICQSMGQQAIMIENLVDLFHATSSPEYLELAEEFASQEKLHAVQTTLFGYTTSCEGFDCQDSEDNAFIANALLKLAQARGETIG